MKIRAIDEKIRILPDGQTCHILGAWIGNNSPYITPWPSVLEKINHDLERWKVTSPTLEVDTMSRWVTAFSARATWPLPASCSKRM
jgi:hypothetical protein